MKKNLLAGAAILALSMFAAAGAKAADINAAIDLSSTTQDAQQAVSQESGSPSARSPTIRPWARRPSAA